MATLEIGRNSEIEKHFQPKIYIYIESRTIKGYTKKRQT